MDYRYIYLPYARRIVDFDLFWETHRRIADEMRAAGIPEAELDVAIEAVLHRIFGDEDDMPDTVH